MKRDYHFVVAAEECTGPLRLDKFLVEKFSDTSRSALQKWIERGNVTVNAKRVAKHHFLFAGNVVDVVVPMTPTLNGAEHFAPAQDIPILYEDDTVLVIEKPVGVLVHPSPAQATGTLVDFLREHCPGIDRVGDEPTRPGIVHRLDRDVSGVMVIAKTQESFLALKKQFHDRKVYKEYCALVHGVPSQQHFVITFKLDRSKKHSNKMAARPMHEDGKDAWTECDVVKTMHGRFALLRVIIRTGRTHQIRAHLAAMDHPIVGDRLYMSRHYQSNHEYPRLFLHAVSLAFDHPTTDQRVSFTSPAPSALLAGAAMRVKAHSATDP